MKDDHACGGYFDSAADDDRYIRIGYVTILRASNDWLGPPAGFVVDKPPVRLKWWHRLFRWVARLFHQEGVKS